MPAVLGKQTSRIAGLLLAGVLVVALPAAYANPPAAKVGVTEGNPRGTGKTAPTAVKNRIAIQINEDDAKKWNAVLGNIHNIQVELGEKNVAIAVVAIGPGLGMLLADSLAANRVQDAMAAGVEFLACGNSVKAQNIALDDLTAGTKVTTSGYVELMHRQQQGWAYLRP
jgi:intracellular sulfur oxidation DsrE/DsrF family protein